MAIKQNRMFTVVLACVFSTLSYVRERLNSTPSGYSLARRPWATLAVNLLYGSQTELAIRRSPQKHNNVYSTNRSLSYT